MGVQGLWHLLQPCARPTKLESLEGRRLAIDSSIWLYHFQMAMRDKEGRTLSNAHILGFLWRILKLIHYGIRPIFVFDGGAPVLKRKTLSGRRQRKTGARDDHKRVAERLLHARMREAALAHVSKGTNAGSRAGEGNQAEDDDGHGLGENVVYMDDLAGTTGASAADARGDALDDGSITALKAAEKENELEAARKKKRDQWQKDPYALPALEQDISTITADTSAAARKGKRGGKKPDIRFATEGELRSLLSSIQPTDLDLDSSFFRSLPTELQYELVGDLRAASRGTSYKRLQAMLASSPTPIDFSRAQIAGLKTRNELTQKVLEVTDEIGDAHIKVPIRVAGARNREYVLIRNKGGQAGFVLGVRETGSSEDKAIAVDEDSASATTMEDDAEKRLTDEDLELEDVEVEAASSNNPFNDPLPVELRNANPNDPVARRQVARELLERRARQLALEKAKERGIVDEGEIMEEQIRQLRNLKRRRGRIGRAGGRGSRRNTGQARTTRKASSTSQAEKSALFRPQAAASGQDESDSDIGHDIDVASDSSTAEEDEEIDIDEAIDLANALDESAKHANTIDLEDGDADEDVLELDDVDTTDYGAADYGSFYHAKDRSGGSSEAAKDPTRVSQLPHKQTFGIEKTPSTQRSPEKLSQRPGTPPSRDTTPTRATRGVPGLGFRLYDREGYPERLNPELLRKTRSHYDEEEEENASDVAKETISGKDAPTAISISDTDSEKGDANFALVSPSPVVTQKFTEEINDKDGNTVKVIDFQDNANTQGDEAVGAGQIERVDDAKHAEHVSSSPPIDAESSYNRLDDDDHDDAVEAAEVNIVPEHPLQRGSPAISLPSMSSGHDKEDVDSADLPEEQAEEGASPSEIARRAASPSPLQNNGHELEKEAPEFDNLVSMAEEEGDVSDMRAEQAEVAERTARFSPDWSPFVEEEEEEEEQPVTLGPDGFPLPTAAELEAMEAEDEADLGQIEGDQNEFVSFLSRAKGRGLNEVRQEVQDEVNRLRTEHATTRRAEGDVTQQMAKEIQLMLRLFGLPYITAPMEAEAQCAELVSIGLADGIITDDSDVFLFGGTFIYKNMFNNKKYVECYKLSDLQHDLGMDRTKLVQLAYLLGSDYTDGLEGVGPVLAMEILSNFTGDDSLIKFREWWIKVQMGNDTPRDTCNATLKRIKRTLRNKVHLDDSWPDVHVLDAYYEPTVDSSDEAFQWGLPDLDSLRSFFQEYLTWDREKTDHYLIPAIEEQNRRSRRTQGTLDQGNFFDLTAGHGVYAGRQRPGFNSSRLQQVITNFRASKKAADERMKKVDGTGQEAVSLSEDDGGDGEESVPEQLLGKEMGKKSRPIVSRRAQRGDPVDVEVPEQATEKEVAVETGKSARVKRAKAKSNKRSAKAKPASANKRRGNATTDRKSESADEDGRQEHDEEWRPKQSKAKKRKTGPAESGPGTHIKQARTFNLDDVNNLPPSRAQSRTLRAPSTSSANGQGSRQNSILISDDDSSDLSSDT